MWHSPHAWQRSNVCLSVPRRASRVHAAEAVDVRRRRALAAALSSVWPAETGRGCGKRYEYPIGKPDIGQPRQQRGHLRRPHGMRAPAATRQLRRCAGVRGQPARPTQRRTTAVHNQCCTTTAAQPRAQHAHRRNRAAPPSTASVTRAAHAPSPDTPAGEWKLPSGAQRTLTSGHSRCRHTPRHRAPLRVREVSGSCRYQHHCQHRHATHLNTATTAIGSFPARIAARCRVRR